MLAPKRPSNPTGYAWAVLFVVFLVSAAAPLNQFKVPPVMPPLMASFQLDLSTAGLLMSIFAVTGIVLALPAGFILQRLGPKAAGLIAAGCTVVGAVAGALSPSAGLLLASRVVEGIGMGLIAVIAPAVVGMWFLAKRTIIMQSKTFRYGEGSSLPGGISPSVDSANIVSRIRRLAKWAVFSMRNPYGYVRRVCE